MPWLFRTSLRTRLINKRSFSPCDFAQLFWPAFVLFLQCSASDMTLYSAPTIYSDKDLSCSLLHRLLHPDSPLCMSESSCMNPSARARLDGTLYRKGSLFHRLHPDSCHFGVELYERATGRHLAGGQIQDSFGHFIVGHQVLLWMQQTTDVLQWSPLFWCTRRASVTSSVSSITTDLHFSTSTSFSLLSALLSTVAISEGPLHSFGLRGLSCICLCSV